MLNNDTLQNFIDYANNTHNQFASASIAAFLVKLSEKYFDTQKKTIDECTKIFQEFVASNIGFLEITPVQFQSVTAYLQAVFNQPVNELDSVTIFTKGVEIGKGLPLKEVFALVCAATMDINVYHTEYPQKTQIQLEADMLQRGRVLCTCLLGLVRDNKCHQGIRHELVGTLNGVYPGAHFIEEVDSFFTATVVQLYLEELKKLLMALQFQLYSAWVAGDENNSNLQRFFADHNERARMKLISLCEEHYINPNNTEVTAKINNIINVDVLIYLPVPLDIHPHARYIYSILIAQPDSNISRNQALERVKASLQSSNLTFGTIPQKTPHFYKVEKIYQRCWKARYMLWGNMEAQNLLRNIWQSCNDYFQNFHIMTDSASTIRLGLMATDMGELKKHIVGLESDADFVTNFFLHFTNFLKENKPGQRALMYMRLRVQQDKIILPDDLIQTQPISHDGFMDIEPYLIGRTLAHALLVSPVNWSITFYGLFSRVIEFIENNLNLPASDPRRGRYDYYKNYLSEFKLLQTFCLRAHADEWGNELAEFPVTAFVPILPNLAELQGEAMCGGYRWNVFLLQKVQEMPDDMLKEILHRSVSFFATQDLFLTILNIPRINQLTFLNSLGSVFLQIPIQNGVLGRILRTLPEANRLTFFNLLGNVFLQRTIQNGDQLANILSTLLEANRQAFLDSLGIEFLRRIIQNGKMLNKVLDELSDADLPIVLNSLGNVFLQGTIQNGDQLANVLSTLPAANRLTFLNSLGIEFLRRIIQNGDQLAPVLGTLPEPNQQTFLNSLGIEFLRRIIQNCKMLNKILDELPRPREDQITFLNSLGIEFWRMLTKKSKYLANALRTMSEAEQQVFLNSLGIEVLQGLIRNEKNYSDNPPVSNLAYGLKELSEANRHVFLDLLGKELWQEVIRSDEQLVDILNQDPEADPKTLLCSRDRKFWKEIINKHEPDLTYIELI